MFKKTFSPQIFTLNLFVLLVLIMVALHPTGQAQAATVYVNTQTELNDAIVAANINSDADTIILDGNITLASALTAISSPITIDGQGYTLSGGGGTTNYRVLRVLAGGNLTVRNLTITLGRAKGTGETPPGDGLGGGGILNDGILTINNCTFSNNISSREGGGAIRNNGTLEVNYSYFTANSATSSNPFGGGIYNVNGTVTINNSTFYNNLASSGGAIRNNGPTMIINRSTLSGNRTSTGGFGGGITNNSTRTLTINDSTLSDNRAASTNGGGIRNDGILNYSRTIIANSLNGDCVFGASGTIGTTNIQNLVETGTIGAAPCFPAYVGDPGLGALANNGGPTQTHAPQFTGVPPSNPVVDLVANGTTSTDQRGARRDYDSNTGDGNTTLLGDLGAVEYRAPTQYCPTPTLPTGVDIPIENLTLNFTSWGGLSCVTVEEMGGVNHPLATYGGPTDGTIQTGNWWHIIGTGSSAGLDVSISLPYASANADSFVCKWPGGLHGQGWDCNPNNTSFVANTSVTRSGISSFSDWAVGQNVGPTAVNVSAFDARAALPWVLGLLAASLLGAISLWAVWQLKKQA